MEARMKIKLTQIGLLLGAGLFAVTCASGPKDYQVELVDEPTPKMMQEEQSKVKTYDRFPYLDWRGAERQ
tara:strand:+ start:73480 stop:73689 length:210 start_codon:yes stop_codon:yes gene_type:complete